MAWTRGRELGKGSTAAVSVATSGGFSGQILAVKSAELSKSEFLQREREILSALSSPYVVGYKGFDVSKESDELYYNLFMEYVPGGTLADEIRRRGGRMDERTIQAFTSQILKAAEYLHSNRVAHCDIKGSNILIIEEHGAKLADFGCAKRVDDCENGAVSISGTPIYMAPETARGAEQGPEADIWAIGCTVIEMATGGPAWPDCGSDPARILYRIAFSDQIPAFPSSLSDQGKDFLSKCLVRDRSRRWTATELLSHPFVTKLESFAKPKSISPTSILDHQLWNASDDESASPTQMSMEVGTSGESQDEDDRIERLAGVSGRPDWGSDEDWIPVRSESGGVSQIRDECFSSESEDGGCCVEVDGGGLGLSIDFGRRSRYAADPSFSSLIISS
uniref:Protein kinase domain-containing protein n=1 Tax=Kalanchoe fedtschenkoi TaxID=63787 RepID=A0A7N0RIQ3_KALFE